MAGWCISRNRMAVFIRKTPHYYKDTNASSTLEFSSLTLMDYVALAFYVKG